ncbi:MAG: sulfite exporter TauE/SafE family protein [Rhodomicrobium sp.]
MDIAYPLSGFAVGALAGLTGMGGGSVMTPLLILLFGVEPATAVGTDLLFAAATKATGANVHAYRGNVEWRVVGLLAAGSMPAALATVWLIRRLPPHAPALEHAITVGIGVALLIAGAGLLFSRSSDRLAAKVAGGLPGPVKPALTIFLGLVLGALVSLTSVGAGAVGIVVLRHLYPRMPAVRLTGSDIAHAVPLTLLAGSGHWLIGDVQPALLGSLLLGSIPGICLTSCCAHRIPDELLRRGLGLVLSVIAARMLMF